MCGTCGCGTGEGGVKILHLDKDGSHFHEHEHHHEDGNNHEHHHDHSHEDGYHHHHHHHGKTLIEVEQDVLRHNELHAQRNKGFFEAKQILALNLVSSPGSGKTTLLERTLEHFKDDLPIYVIEGDQQTTNDARRIAETGTPVVQINTGKGCHLESDMVYQAVKELNMKEHSILMIENVGNLVCPSMFNLGENKRVVIISTTEGEDKPLKYPDMFHTSDICVINKTDLLPYLDFDLKALKENALKVNPELKFFELSATKGIGMDDWFEWLKKEMQSL